MKPKNVIFGFVTIIIGFLVPFLIAEIALQFSPVNTGLATLPVNEANPVQRFTPNRDFTFSKGWFFDIVNHGHVNNFGYVNNIDYEQKKTTPLLAVVGDSYIEAAMVPYDETLHGRLKHSLADNGNRVYSFAASGAALSQYLVFAQYARDVFQPVGLVIVIIGNDFDESLCIYSIGAAQHCYQQTDNKGLILKRINYKPTLLKTIARKSALIRHIHRNTAGLRFTLLTAKHKKENMKFVGNKRADFDQQKLNLSKKAVDQFLIDLPQRSGLATENIVFVVDGLRPQLYDAEKLPEVKDSYVAIMREYFMTLANAKGFEVIDMQPRFIKKYLHDKARFEFNTDHHWNGAGHSAASSAVEQSKMFERLFKQEDLEKASL